jgi:hypothetical protein
MEKEAEHPEEAMDGTPSGDREERARDARDREVIEDEESSSGHLGNQGRMQSFNETPFFDKRGDKGGSF